MKQISKKTWNRTRAAHLINRAGFGASPADIDTLATRDPRDLVAELLAFGGAEDDFPKPTWVQPGAEKPLVDYREMKNLEPDERRKKQQMVRRLQQNQLFETKAWWLYRMRHSEFPLQEKLTLFWHGHFATSAQKVKNGYLMYQQNQTFRRLAAANWEELVNAVGKDPAMLVYLDQARSNRKKPNENWARELMELFTLGEGHYTEEDIKEAARAFTGWSMEREDQSFVNRVRLHDAGEKNFFGESGAFTGEDIIHLILKQDQAARFIAAKLWSFFAYEGPDPELVGHLAEVLRKNNYELKPLLQEIFLSEAFYSNPAMRTQIKSPVQWLVGTLKVLDAPTPHPRLTVQGLDLLGQNLLEPPNVKGWDGGTAWMTTSALINRYNFAGILCRGMSKDAAKGFVGRGIMPMDMEEGMDMMMDRVQQARRGQPLIGSIIDPDKILPPESRASRERIQQTLFNRLYQSQLREQDRTAFQAYLETTPPPNTWKTLDVQRAVHMLMSTPQYQLT